MSGNKNYSCHNDCTPYPNLMSLNSISSTEQLLYLGLHDHLCKTMSHQVSNESTSLYTASQNQLQSCPHNTACLLELVHNYIFVWFINQQFCGCVYRWVTHRFPVATILGFLWRCLEPDPVPMYLLSEHTVFAVTSYQRTCCSKLSTGWRTVDFRRHWNTLNLLNY